MRLIDDKIMHQHLDAPKITAQATIQVPSGLIQVGGGCAGAHLYIFQFPSGLIHLGGGFAGAHLSVFQLPSGFIPLGGGCAGAHLSII